MDDGSRAFRRVCDNMKFHQYVASRGMASVETIFRNLRGKAFGFPDLICDQVLDLARSILGEHNIGFYHIDHELGIDWQTTQTYDVFYTIDYFGQEQNIAGTRAPLAPIVIRDAVWFPYPDRPVEAGEIWFNSFRKFAWPANGSIMISNINLENTTVLGVLPLEGVPHAFKATSPRELVARRTNYDVAADLLRRYLVGRATFPSVVPLVVPHRDEVVARLAEQQIRLPGMWINRTGCDNVLYDTLMLLPCDSRFSVQDMRDRASAIVAAIEASHGLRRASVL